MLFEMFGTSPAKSGFPVESMTFAGNSTPIHRRRATTALICATLAGTDYHSEVSRTCGEDFVNPKLIVAVLVITATPLCAQAQKTNTVTKADVQKVVQLISGDKAKTQIYCDIGKLNEQMAEIDETKDAKKAAAL